MSAKTQTPGLEQTILLTVVGLLLIPAVFLITTWAWIYLILFAGLQSYTTIWVEYYVSPVLRLSVALMIAGNYWFRVGTKRASRLFIAVHSVVAVIFGLMFLALALAYSTR